MIPLVGSIPVFARSLPELELELDELEELELLGVAFGSTDHFA
jgi:hypothetical protein